MSWLNLSGNVSSLTNNISSFTREVLTEAGSEAEERFAEEDAGLQLHSACYKIKELETKIARLKAEVDRVNCVNHELQERAESAELQVQAMSFQYRNLILEKENELKRIHGLQCNGDLDESTHHSDSIFLDDEDELFMLHSRLEKLAKHNTKLQEQCENWRQASPKNADDNVLALRDSQQQEVAALQSAHNQRISSLNKRHKEEVQNLKEQILKLSGQRESHDLKARSDESELVLVRHCATEEELLRAKSELQLKDKLISSLQAELRLAIDAVAEEQDSRAEVAYSLDKSELDRLREELSQMTSENQALTMELQMKEIVLSSIERQIRESSSDLKEFNITDFESWFSEIALGTNMRNIGLSSKSTEIDYNSLKEIIELSVRSFPYVPSAGNFVIEGFTEWMCQLKAFVDLLEGEAKSGKTIIAHCEEEIRSFAPCSKDFEIKHFSKWLGSLKEKLSAQDLRIDSLLLDKKRLVESNEGFLSENEKLQKDFTSKQCVLNSDCKLNVEKDIENHDSNKSLPVTCNSQPLQMCSSQMQETQSLISCGCAELMTEIAMLKSDIARKDHILTSVESGIRDFDDEDVSFTVYQFSSWVQKVQAKMDSLAEDLLFEQETRSDEERYREEERKKWNHTFMQMQQEIADLKVELYKVSASQSLVDAPERDQQYVCEDNESYMSAQEKLIEAITRCEALNVELAIVAAEKDNLRADLDKFTAQQRRNSGRNEKNLETLIFLRYADLITECVREILNDGNPVDLVNNLQRLSDLSLEQKNPQVLDLSAAIQALGRKYLSSLVLGPCKDHPVGDRKNESLGLGLGQPIDHSTSYRDLIAEAAQAHSQCLHQRRELTKKSAELIEHSSELDISSSIARLKSSGSGHANVDQVCTASACPAPGNIPALMNSEGCEELSRREEIMRVLYDSLQVLCGVLQQECPDAPLVSDIRTCYADLLEYTTKDFEDCIKSFEKLFFWMAQHYAECRADAEKWKRLYDDVNVRHISQQTTVESLNENVSDLRTQRIVLQDSVDTLREELEGVAQSYHHTLCENEVLQADLDELHVRMDTNEMDDSKEISELKMQLEDLMKERERFINIVSQRRGSIQAQQPEDAIMKSDDLRVVQEHLEATRLLMADGDSPNQQLEQESVRTKRAIDLFNDDIDQLQVGGPVENRSVDINRTGEGGYADIIEESGSLPFSRSNVVDVRHQHFVEEELVGELDLVQVQALNSASLEVSIEDLDVSQLTDSGVGSLSLQVEQLQILLAEKSSECKHLEGRIRKLTERNPELLPLDLLQEESYQLKQLLLERERELARMRASLVESQNSSSDLILVQQECRHLKQLMSSSFQDLQRAQTVLNEKEDECQILKARLLEARNENSDLVLVREESKQLKVMLMEKDKELQSSRLNPVSELASVLQDLHMLQEECRRTKAFLLEKDEQCRALQVELADLRKRNSDMEFLHEECRQLKSMLINQERTPRGAQERGMNGTSQTISGENLHLRDALSQQQQELTVLKRRLAVAENSCSSVDLLHEECRQLKSMLAERERQLLGSDPHASAESHSRYSALVGQYNTLVLHYQQLQDRFAQKEREAQELQMALSENDAQEENIHLLQTEYRAVEEKLCLREKELAELRDRLFAAETLCERAYTYKEQFAQLKKILSDKETELTNLKLHSSGSSILESESVSLLQQEMNQLRTMLYARDKEFCDTQAVLMKRTFELQQLQQVLEATAEDREQFRHSTIERDLCEQLRSDLRSRDSVITYLNASLATLQTDLDMCTLKLRDKDDDLDKLRGLLACSKEAQEGFLQDLRDMRDKSSAEISELKAKAKECVMGSENLTHARSDLHEANKNLRAANVTILELKNAKVALEGDVLRLGKEVLGKETGMLAVIGRINGTVPDATSHQEVIARQIEDESQMSVGFLNKDEELTNAPKLLDSGGPEGVLGELAQLEKAERHLPDVFPSPSSRLVSDSEDVSLKEVVSDATVSLRSKLGECERLGGEIPKIMTKNNSLIGEVAKLENDLHKLETVMEAKSKQFELEKLRAQEVEAKFKLQQRKSKAALLVKEKALASSRKEIVELAEKIKAQENHARALNEKMEGLSHAVREKDEKIQQLSLSLDALKDVLELRNNELESSSAALTALKESSKNQLSKMEEDHSQLRSLFDEKNRETEMKQNLISELCTQLTERQDLHALYAEKCSECEEIRKELNVLQNGLLRGHAVIAEPNNLQASAEKSSELSLDEARDCERFKLEINLLESKVHDLESKLDKQAWSEHQHEAARVEMRRLENDLAESRSVATALEADLNLAKSSLELVTRKLADTKMTVAENNARIDELESSLGRFESSSNIKSGVTSVSRNDADGSIEVSKEQYVPFSSRTHSDVHSSAYDVILRLQKEKTELFEEGHSSALRIRELERAKQALENRVREFEVLVKHQEVKCKEIEAKTSRDLERLRNHLLKMEEGYTKDILEGKEREKILEGELESVKSLLNQKSLNFQSTSDEFRGAMSDLQEQVKALVVQRDHLSAELSKRKQLGDHDTITIKNLHLALEQLQREKDEQCAYLTETSRRQLEDAQSQIDELRAKENHSQTRMYEARLAVQGVAKLSTDIQQKDEEVKTYKDQVASLISLVQQRELQLRKVIDAAEHRLDRALMKNLLVSYFHAPESQRADIVHVIGGLLGLSSAEIEKIGTGLAPSSGGWVSNVRFFGNTPAKQQPDTPARKAFRNELLKTASQSFSELFVTFLQHETENGSGMQTASLTHADIPVTLPVPILQPSNGAPMFSTLPQPPVKSSISLLASPRASSPGQDFLRVHTHQTQSVQKTLLAT